MLLPILNVMAFADKKVGKKIARILLKNLPSHIIMDSSYKDILTSALPKEIGESILKHGGEVIEEIRHHYTEMINDFVTARVDNPDKCGGLLDHQIEIYENYIDQHGKAVNKHRALLT